MVPQSIRNPLGVTVYGSALLRTEPDLAEAWLAISRVAKDPAEAFKQTRGAVLAVREALANSGIDAGAMEVPRIAVEDAFEGFAPNRKFIGYKAAVTFRIRVHDLELLEPSSSVRWPLAQITFSVSVTKRPSSAISGKTRGAMLSPRPEKRPRLTVNRPAVSWGGHPYRGCGPRHSKPAVSRPRVDGRRLARRGEGSLGSGSLTVAAAVVLVYTLLPGT